MFSTPKSAFSKVCLPVMLVAGVASMGLADGPSSDSQVSFGGNYFFNTLSHNWTPNLCVAAPLSPRFFCGKVNSKDGYSADNNLVNCQFVGIATAGLSNLGEYLQNIESSAESDNNCFRSLQYYGGFGIGMQLNVGPGNIVAFSSGYMVTTEPGRVPRGVAFFGLGLRFSGS